MAAEDVPAGAASAPVARASALAEPAWVRRTLIGLALIFLALFLFVPLAAVFVQAFSKGLGVYWAAIVDDDALSALKLTLLATAIAVPLNTIFGIAAAWAIARFRFPG
ncbi:MAG TPA: sulfate ABC transporter permease subunit CysW, partial [Burkholderiaceae bacterium]|nr:sulfate ABC transporter permease subunit CysW [Burkholderiaceae bacterium]